MTNEIFWLYYLEQLVILHSSNLNTYRHNFSFSATLFQLLASLPNDHDALWVKERIGGRAGQKKTKIGGDISGVENEACVRPYGACVGKSPLFASVFASP